MEQKVIDLSKRISKNFKEQDKEQLYKFTPSLVLANPESLDVLENHGVVLKKSSQMIVLLIEPKELERELKLAEEMGFISAYQQNPRHLTQPIEMVIKRMAKSDSLGVTYKDENGKYASFLFSQRAFDYIIGQYDNVKELSPSNPPIGDNLELSEIKEDALHILESVALEDRKEEIYARIDYIANNGLSEKEMLIEAFKIIDGDKNLLISKIDEVLEQKEEKGMKLAV